VKRILVAEDEPTTRLLIRRMLEAEGFEVTVAEDGIEALERYTAEPFDLLLADVRMPRLSGLDLLARLRDVAGGVRAVVMTADDTPETLLEAVRRHATRYIAKPVERATLIEAVNAALLVPHVRPIEVLSARPEWVELRVPCEIAAAERIQSFLSHLEADLPAEVRESVGLAFRELLMNAIEWGGEFDPTRTVRIACLRTRRMVLYHIADPGKGFSFEDLPHSALSNPPGEPVRHLEAREKKAIRAGGFGLLMARTVVDELIYNEAHNQVVLIKYLD
jgi:CheY-like chemotaxis protein/anti-sigma regulatory factor (Ser/Thr protein kinase)